MTDEEHDLLQLVYAEAHGRLDKWVPVTELPSAALALNRNGYLNLFQAGPDVWRVALTESGRDLARQLRSDCSRASRKSP